MKVLIISCSATLMIFLLFACNSIGGNKFYDKGVEYASEGKFIEARAELKEALKIERPSPYPSGISLSLSRIESAIELKVKKEAIMHYFKGIIFAGKGMLDLAISEYTKAIEIDIEFAPFYNERARIYQRKHNFDQAVADYTKAIKINPKYAYAHFNRGVAYDGKKQYDNSIVDYSRALEIESRFAPAYNKRGLAFARIEKYANAVSDFTKAIEINSRYASAYHNRGFVLLVKLKEKSNGCKDLYMACTLGSCRNYNASKREGLCE